MKILVACEESQAVTKELRELGHEAYSCDIQECSGGHPEWHIMEDVIPLLNGNCSFRVQDATEGKKTIWDRWDMIIAFPPCTHLAVSGAPHFEKKREDGRQREGIEFFCKFLTADCDKIVVENPVNIISGDYVKKWFPDLAEKYGLPLEPTQRIHPWMFGDNFSKNTCLWIKGLKPLVPQTLEEPEMEWKEWVDKKTGKKKRQNMWYYDAFKNSKTAEERSRIRSKTFPGIAKAMAEQWTKVKVESIQWTGKNPEEVLKFVGKNYYVSFDGDLIINTLKGEMIVCVGDYIVKDAIGNLYPYSQDEFEKKYELI